MNMVYIHSPRLIVTKLANETCSVFEVVGMHSVGPWPSSPSIIVFVNTPPCMSTPWDSV